MAEITLTEAQHRWLDHETALAIDRANLRQLEAAPTGPAKRSSDAVGAAEGQEALRGLGPQPPYPMSNYQSGLKEALGPADCAPGSALMRLSSRSLARTSPEHLERSSMTPDERRIALLTSD